MKRTGEIITDIFYFETAKATIQEIKETVFDSVAEWAVKESGYMGIDWEEINSLDIRIEMKFVSNGVDEGPTSGIQAYAILYY